MRKLFSRTAALLLLSVGAVQQNASAQCTPTPFTFNATATVVGTPGAVGTKYRYPNIRAGIDAEFVIDSIYGGATVRSEDVAPGATNPQGGTYSGYAAAWQPVITTPQNSIAGEGAVRWFINFYVAGTNYGTPYSLGCVSLMAVDIDGDNGQLKEFVQVTNPYSFSGQADGAFLDYTSNTGRLRAVARDITTIPNIDSTAKQAMAVFRYKNVSSFRYTTGFIKGTVATVDRQFCLFFGFNTNFPNSFSRFYDTDGDGITDINDPNDLDDDNDGIRDTNEYPAGYPDPLDDADGDGLANYEDSSPGGVLQGIPLGFSWIDVNGDGINDRYDADLDGTINSLDRDSDNDGIPDLVEAGGVDTNGDGVVDYTGTWASNDTDGDGLIDRYDNIENNPNIVGVTIRNLDSDGDGIANALDLDSDNDGIPDIVEAGGVDANGDGRIDNYVDSDFDGFCDLVDGDVGDDGMVENGGAAALILTGTYTSNSNPNPVSYPQGIANDDGRGLPNFIDLDSDDDGIADVTEAGGTDANYDGKIDNFTDANGDGFSDNVTGTATGLLVTGADTNNDGRPDSYPFDNADGTGRPNPYDADSDDDGVPDLIECGGIDTNGGGRIDTPLTDANNNGWADVYDPTATGGINLRTLDANGAVAGGGLFDFDGDGIPNYRDLDSDNDGIPDIIEQGGVDANNDGKIDFTGTYAANDLDNDGLIDAYDPVNNGTSTTFVAGVALITAAGPLNGNNIPTVYSVGDNFDGTSLINMLDLDADGDGILDTRESGISAGTGVTLDANNDGVINASDAGFADANGDGWADAVKALGTYTLRNTDGVGNPNYLDIDSDDDGIVDNIEGQATATYLAPANADADADGIDNNYDNNNALFAGAANNGITLVDSDGDGVADYRDLDSDNDGYPDFVEGHDFVGDNLPHANTNTKNGVRGGTVDADNDGLLDGYDNNTASPAPTNGTTNAAATSTYPNIDAPLTVERDWREAANTDGDVAGLANINDIDDDNDGIPDNIECGGFFPLADFDGDGVPNYLDPTPGTGVGAPPAFVDVNGDRINDAYDADMDGIINSLDLDSDNDGIPDIIEAGGTDTDGNGLVDVYVDTNNNGLADIYDALVTGGVAIANLDTDGDGIPNSRDLDSDGDGIPDVVEAGGTDANNDGRIDNYTDANGNGFANSIETGTKLIVTGADTNADGKPDSYPRSLANMDGMGLPNPYDLDSDGDGILDARESGLLRDTDNNGVISSTESADTDGDGWADAIKASTTSALVLRNSDAIGNPNYLDIDSDDDGITDNVEGQATATYKLPLGTDADGDGIDDAYDNATSTFGGTSLNGITPVNTDSPVDNMPDYTDMDSDNDGQTDLREGLGNPTYTIASTADTDGDGLLDVFDTFAMTTTAPATPWNNVTMTKMGVNGTTTGPATSGNNNTPLPKTSVINGADRDWRNAAYILPIKLVTFTAVYSNHVTNLSWTAANETRSDRYVVERSIDGKNFQAITSVNARGNGGNYTAADNAVPAVNVVYYRLQMVDASGNFTYSKVVAIKLVTDKMNLSIYPNPVVDMVSISFASAKTQAVTIKVYNASGAQVMTKAFQAQVGTNTLQLTDWNRLPAGDYMIEVGNENFKMIEKISHLH